MNVRKRNHAYHPNYQQYDLALEKLRKSEALWFKIANNRASVLEKMANFENLFTAKIAFSALAEIPFLSAPSYLQKAELLYAKLLKKEAYDEARAYLKRADEASSLYIKQTLYAEAERKFSVLAKFSDAEYFAKKAEQKLLASFDQESMIQVTHSVSKPALSRVHFFGQRPKIEDTEESCPELKILIEGGYDVCLRPTLPAITQELHTTTIITASGAFQFHEGKKEYMLVLEPAELHKLGLRRYLIKAKSLEIPRLSIRTQLPSEQLKELDLALRAKGGRSLEDGDHLKQQCKFL